jgi:nucleotide-binding universal stress UspA family protein
MVIGSCHRGLIGRVAYGSVGTDLINGSPCAVAVAPRGYASENPSFGRVGVAFDGTPEAWSALETGIGLAERAHAKLTVVTVSEGIDEKVEAGLDQSRRVLDLALARVPEGLGIRGMVMGGAPDKMISEATRDLDLMVIGSKGYGPIRRVFAGGVAQKVLRQAHSAVMVLPRGKGIDPLGARAQTQTTGVRG